MKSKDKKTGYSIIELLTVMTIIVILIGLLLPAFNSIRRYSRVVRQKGQFHDMGSALEMFRIDFDEYPDSTWYDPCNVPYCGAMKLCEAMAGQDGLGFHLDSKFIFGGGPGVNPLYPPSPGSPPWPDWYQENLRSRKEYMESEDFEIRSLEELWSDTTSVVGVSFDPNCVILSDVFRSVRIKIGFDIGKRVGMPILYYRASASKLGHDPCEPDFPGNIYNYKDNHPLVGLGLPWDQAIFHPLFQFGKGLEGQVFYEQTRDDKATPIDRPYRKDTYILISAGPDGIYGTRDDVRNFAK